jgi:hypothetical protein
MYKILSNILLSRLTPYAEKHFWCNRSMTDHIFCISQILEKKYNYSEAEHQLLINVKKANDSVRTEALYHTLIQFGIPLKLITLIKM